MGLFNINITMPQRTRKLPFWRVHVWGLHLPALSIYVVTQLHVLYLHWQKFHGKNFRKPLLFGGFQATAPFWGPDKDASPLSWTMHRQAYQQKSSGWSPAHVVPHFTAGEKIRLWNIKQKNVSEGVMADPGQEPKFSPDPTKFLRLSLRDPWVSR